MDRDMKLDIKAQMHRTSQYPPPQIFHPMVNLLTPQSSKRQKIPVVVILIDSGPTLFLAWDVVRDYLIKRFPEENPSLQPLVGFITYGTPGSDGCPVLVYRFFAEGAHQLRKNPDEFKVGHSCTAAAGSSTGMFVLAGYAAAIEMIDTFLNRINREHREMYSHHLWHCAAQPDDAEHPPWINSRTLTWETLPAELEKRDIEYSTIYVQPSPTFGLSSANVDAPVIPWFPTCPVHTIPLPRFTPSPELGSNDQWVGMLELRHVDPPLHVHVLTEDPFGDFINMAKSLVTRTCSVHSVDNRVPGVDEEMYEGNSPPGDGAVPSRV
ncbi:hypothetical protein BJV78DRAFT_630309 [Lactifluus subvellereus]|nr:hypothetical protein BJV78DRAFT_630309 [Lactifluus subvellereus]